MKKSPSAGILFCVGILFTILKLSNVLHWNWWIVTMPFWIGFVLALGVFLLIDYLNFIHSTVARWKSKKAKS